MKQYKTWQLILMNLILWPLLIFCILLVFAFATQPLGTR